MDKKTDVSILTWILVAFCIINIFFLVTGKLGFDAKGLGIITAVALTLAMYSFLYKDNPVFKIAENLFVGVAMGYWIIITWFNILKPDVFETLIVPSFQGYRQCTSVRCYYPHATWDFYAFEIFK